MVVAALVITGVILLLEFRTLSSPEGAWPRVADLLPYDEEPVGWEVQAGMGYSRWTGYAQFFFVDDADNFSINLRLQVDLDKLDLLLAEDQIGRTVTASGTLVVQGRELRYVDFESTGDDGHYRGRTVDLSHADAPDGMLIDFLREVAGPAITDEDVQRELAPFHVGPDR